MRYREFAPIPSIADAVERVWVLDGDASEAGPPEPILPDGRPELVLHLGDPFERCDGRGAWRQAAVLFAGQVTEPLVLRPTGRVAVVGVRFHPHGAATCLATPLHELSGLTLDVADIAGPLRRELGEVQESGDVLRAAAAVQQVLARWIDRSRLDARLGFVVGAIDRTRGRASIDAVARAAGVTRRHLERRFLADVGITPKRLARIARFQHALQMLERQPPAGGGARTAAACGYADQAHFIRDFRELAGCPPGQHLLRHGQLTGFFIDR